MTKKELENALEPFGDGTIINVYSTYCERGHLCSRPGAITKVIYDVGHTKEVILCSD